MKPYQIALGLALAGAAGLLLFGDRAPSSGVAEAVDRKPAAGRGAAGTAGMQAPAPRTVRSEGKPQAEAAILRLTPRAALIGEAGEAAFASGEGVFLGQSWNPAPPPPPPPSKTPPPPPQAPPLPFTMIGKAVGDGAWEVYLTRADKTYVARVGAVIDGVYRVDAIAPPLMTVTYLPLNQVQQLNIGVID